MDCFHPQLGSCHPQHVPNEDRFIQQPLWIHDTMTKYKENKSYNITGRQGVRHHFLKLETQGIAEISLKLKLQDGVQRQRCWRASYLQLNVDLTYHSSQIPWPSHSQGNTRVSHCYPRHISGFALRIAPPFDTTGLHNPSIQTNNKFKRRINKNNKHGINRAWVITTL